jgi:hydroxymethylbilane synthase
VAAVDGSVSLRRSLSGPVDDPEALGNALAALLVEDGAAELVPPRLRTSIEPAPAADAETRTTPSTTREGDT